MECTEHRGYNTKFYEIKHGDNVFYCKMIQTHDYSSSLNITIWVKPQTVTIKIPIEPYYENDNFPYTYYSQEKNPFYDFSWDDGEIDVESIRVPIQRYFLEQICEYLQPNEIGSITKSFVQNFWEKNGRYIKMFEEVVPLLKRAVSDEKILTKPAERYP